MRIALAVVLAASLSAATFVSAKPMCSVECGGTEFLAAAGARGLRPQSDKPCATVEMRENKFYAPLGKAGGFYASSFKLEVDAESCDKLKIDDVLK